jgi:hypothetical protein
LTFCGAGATLRRAVVERETGAEAMFTCVDHLGFAVRDIEESVAF